MSLQKIYKFQANLGYNKILKDVNQIRDSNFKKIKKIFFFFWQKWKITRDVFRLNKILGIQVKKI